MAAKLWRTPSVVPALSYEDVPAAVEFLTRALEVPIDAVDLEGHYWEFSERDRELDPTEWKLPPGIKMGA
jgi:hypothetical protein